jgi:hypothetical protein
LSLSTNLGILCFRFRSVRTQLPMLWQPVWSSFLLPEVEACTSTPNAHCSLDRLGPLCWLLARCCPPLSIAFRTAFDHAVTCFTPSLSLHSYVILWVRVVHCRHSDGSCLAFSAWVSALSLRGSPQCVLTLTMNVHAPLNTCSLTHSMIDVMMSAFASPASVVRGPLPIHCEILLRAVSLSHR